MLQQSYAVANSISFVFTHTARNRITSSCYCNRKAGIWQGGYETEESPLLQVRVVMVVTPETVPPLRGCFRYLAGLPGPVPPTLLNNLTSPSLPTLYHRPVTVEPGALSYPSFLFLILCPLISLLFYFLILLFFGVGGRVCCPSGSPFRPFLALFTIAA